MLLHSFLLTLSFINSPALLIPTTASGKFWTRLAPGDMSRSALAPRPSCLLSHPQSLLPLQGWAGRAGVAAGSQEHFRPTKCHHLHDGKPLLGSGRLKTVRQTLLTLSPQVMLYETLLPRSVVSDHILGISRFLAREQSI